MNDLAAIPVQVLHSCCQICVETRISGRTGLLTRNMASRSRVNPENENHCLVLRIQGVAQAVRPGAAICASTEGSQRFSVRLPCRRAAASERGTERVTAPFVNANEDRARQGSAENGSRNSARFSGPLPRRAVPNASHSGSNSHVPLLFHHTPRGSYAS